MVGMHAQSKTIWFEIFYWKIKKQIFFCLQNFPPDKRHPRYRSKYGKYGPAGSRYGFLRTACQPISVENFEKPINNKSY